MIKFPSINQFANLVYQVKHAAKFVGLDENGVPMYDEGAELPTLSFVGTVKLHGTNASICYNVEDQTIQYQSRERVLSLTSDNAGFMMHMQKHEQDLLKYFKAIATVNPGLKNIVLFGEWCGRSIQKGVGVSELPKMFVIFDMRVISLDDQGEEVSKWHNVIRIMTITDPEIKYITDFQTFSIDIDFNNPHIAQNEIRDLTLAVENECPVAKAYGIENSVGEGIVWKCVTPGWESSQFWMKTKGEKHSATKVKTIAAVDVEMFDKIKDFVEYAVTENRLEQGLQFIQTEMGLLLSKASTGDFVKWVQNDVLKEEALSISQSGIDSKKLIGMIGKKASTWFIKRIII